MICMPQCVADTASMCCRYCLNVLPILLYGPVLSLVIGGGGQSKATRHRLVVEVLFYEQLFGPFLISIIERRGTEKRRRYWPWKLQKMHEERAYFWIEVLGEGAWFCCAQSLACIYIQGQILCLFISRFANTMQPIEPHRFGRSTK